ncbi:type II toxin-antitoxin system Phd/YefM family antitoxin [Wenxinia saemankumensis]|uniref:Antitoxin n=1 Tax=Wenxinia saemankumensis TaxID=1447782 RepID=A0A1M6I128_9RHOB|nr:type II toxin-antitoxin system prevent-host-death family antitoxin [Wenxinia saemankumensis]SHJ28095.1 prevent-host-death family protein [Wenxinia saemankumensis]
MQLNVSEARARLSELMAAAERGEEAVIARRGNPVVRLIPVKSSSGVRLGALKGIVPSESIPDFLAPMSAETRKSWGA